MNEKQISGHSDAWVIEQLIAAWQPAVKEAAMHVTEEIFEWSSDDMRQKYFDIFLSLEMPVVIMRILL